MRLVEQGLLDLDRPVLKYLPGFQFSDPWRGRKVTLRHLLSHTSGLPAAGKDWGPRDPDSLRRFVYEQIPHYAFLAEPGTVHLYSSTAFCLAGHVAEAVTGKFYEDLVQEQVLEPLQMTRTTFDPAVALTYPAALPHESGPAGELRVAHRIACNASGNPSGFALGSTADLANLAKMFLNQGRLAGERFLSPASIAEMQRPHASRYLEGHANPLAGLNRGYGLGFYTGEYKGRRAARHGGMGQSYNCFFDLFPDEQAGIVLLTNHGQEEPLMALVAALYDHVLDLSRPGAQMASQEPFTWTLPSKEELNRYAGAYLNVETAGLARFDPLEEEPSLEQQGESFPLVKSGEGRYFADISETYRLPVAFIEDREGRVAHVMISGEPYFPVEVDPDFQPVLAQMNSFEGVYKDPSNPNLEEIFTVRCREGRLFITEGGHEAPCKAIGERTFLSELGLIEFEDSERSDAKVLVWGKATRYYPFDPVAFRTLGLIRYLVEGRVS
jgi:CubicO group peptidase (beta-lactamase class C family)